MSDAQFDAQNEMESAGTLRRRLGAPMPLGVALDIAIQTGRALERMHRRGSVYGRLQPESILLAGQHRVTLSDRRPAQTPAEAAACYLSPEQVTGQPPRPASDVYALGCILFEMLTGRPPFPAGASLEAAIASPPPLPHQLNPSIPAAVEQVVLRTLVKEPGGRFSTAGELADALQRNCPALVRARQVVRDVDAPVRDTLRTVRDKASRLISRVGKRRFVLAAAVVAIAVLGVGLGLSEAGRRRSRAATLVTRGELMLAAAAWDEALAACQQALELNPRNLQAGNCVEMAAEGQQQDSWFSQGERHLTQGEWKQAVDRFETVRQVRPDYPGLDQHLLEAYQGYAQHLVSVGEAEKAAEWLTAAVALQPDDASTLQQKRQVDLYLQGCEAYEADEWVAAITALHEVYEIDSTYQSDLAQLLLDAYVEHGDALEAEGEWCEAWQAYDQASQIAEADTREGQRRREDVEIQCWPPTSTFTPTPTPTTTPSPTPTPTPSATPTATPIPVRYCWTGEFKGIEEIAFPLISIRGRVVNRWGRGAKDVLVRVGAYEWHVDVRTGAGGDFRVDGIAQPLEWTVSLPGLRVSVQVPITEGGQMGVVEFVERRCR